MLGRCSEVVLGWQHGRWHGGQRTKFTRRCVAVEGIRRNGHGARRRVEEKLFRRRGGSRLRNRGGCEMRVECEMGNAGRNKKTQTKKSAKNNTGTPKIKIRVKEKTHFTRLIEPHTLWPLVPNLASFPSVLLSVLLSSYLPSNSSPMALSCRSAHALLPPATPRPRPALFLMRLGCRLLPTVLAPRSAPRLWIDSIRVPNFKFASVRAVACPPNSRPAEA